MRALAALLIAFAIVRLVLCIFEAAERANGMERRP